MVIAGAFYMLDRASVRAWFLDVYRVESNGVSGPLIVRRRGCEKYGVSEAE